MKKILSVLLAVLLVASLGVTAFAAEEETVVLDDMGMTLTYPAEYSELKGVIMPYPMGALTHDPDMYLMAILYFAMPKQQFNEIMDKGQAATEEENDALLAAEGSLGMMIVTNASEEEFKALFDGATPEELNAAEVGKADGYTFLYAADSDEEYIASIDKEFADEFTGVQQSFAEVLKNGKFYAPVDPLASMVGLTFNFETVDVDGNKVTSEELFGKNKVTMVNYWGTWCGPCRGELAELGEINERLADKGCGIIGIVEDAVADDQETLKAAKDLLTENKVGYVNLVPNKDMAEILDKVTAYPTSFFVDKTGKILCTPIEGAAVEEYEKTIDSLLKGEEKITRSAAPKAQDNGLDCYRVIVYDVDGNPVQGVAIQFCSDDMCNMAKTDADGVATFNMDEGMEYTVHVLKVPAGYEKNAGEFLTETTYSDVTIFLEKAA